MAQNPLLGELVFIVVVLLALTFLGLVGFLRQSTTRGHPVYCDL